MSKIAIYGPGLAALLLVGCMNKPDPAAIEAAREAARQQAQQAEAEKSRRQAERAFERLDADLGR